MTKRLTLTTLTTLVFLSLTFGAQWTGQATAAPQSQPSTASAQQSSPSQMQDMQMQDMMKMHQQMMAEMKAGNAKLEELVKQMNAAKGEAKVDATAAVVTELVRQHTAMTDHMGQMSQHMMGGRGMMKK